MKKRIIAIIGLCFILALTFTPCLTVYANLPSMPDPIYIYFPYDYTYLYIVEIDPSNHKYIAIYSWENYVFYDDYIATAYYTDEFDTLDELYIAIQSPNLSIWHRGYRIGAPEVRVKTNNPYIKCYVPSGHSQQPYYITRDKSTSYKLSTSAHFYNKYDLNYRKLNYNTYNCYTDYYFPPDHNNEILYNSDVNIKFYPNEGYSFYGLTNYFTVKSWNNSSISYSIIHNPQSYNDYLELKFTMSTEVHINVNASQYTNVNYYTNNVSLSYSPDIYVVGSVFNSVITPFQGYTIDNVKVLFQANGAPYPTDITETVYDPDTQTISLPRLQGLSIGIYINSSVPPIEPPVDPDPGGDESEDPGGDESDDPGGDISHDPNDPYWMDFSEADIDYGEETSNIKEEIGEYDDLETSISDQTTSNIDEVINTSMDPDVVQFMIDFQSGMSFLYDNELIIAGIGTCGVFMVIGFLLFGKKGHG